jgi:hypothetical protein
VAGLARRIASFPAEAVRSTKQVFNELTVPGADAIRADARRFQQLVRSDAIKARLASLFAQGLQTRSPIELDLGERIGALRQTKFDAAPAPSAALIPTGSAGDHRRRAIGR